MFERELVQEQERQRERRRAAARWLASDRPLFARAELEEGRAATPGKRTQVEDRAWWEGRWAAPGRCAPSAAAPEGEPDRPGFEDCRASALREVLGALAHVPALARATLEAADEVAAWRAVPALSGPPPRGAPTPDGRALWRAAERRAVTLFRRAEDHAEAAADDPAVAEALARIGSGAPLSAEVRARLEPALGGAQLATVRVHTDAVAAEAARAVRARAFTVGEDIFFADGAYAPDSVDGEHLLAHELAHVLQGRDGRTQRGDSGPRVSTPEDPLEREAARVADAVAARAAVGAPAAAARERRRPPDAPARAGELAAWATLGGAARIWRMTNESGASQAKSDGPLAAIDELIRKAIGDLRPTLKDGTLASSLALIVKPDKEVQAEFWKQNPQRKGETILGFYERETRTVWIGQTHEHNLGVQVHECMHAYSHPDTQRLGAGPNEGMTEFFADQICRRGNVAPSGGYPAQVKGVAELIAVVGVGLVARAYFDGQIDALIAAFPSKHHYARWMAKLDPCGGPYADPGLARIELPPIPPAPAKPASPAVVSQPAVDNAAPPGLATSAPKGASEPEGIASEPGGPAPSKLEDTAVETKMVEGKGAEAEPSSVEQEIDKTARKYQGIDRGRVESLYGKPARSALEATLANENTPLVGPTTTVDPALYIMAIQACASPGFVEGFSSSAATGAAIYFYDRMRKQESQDDRARAVATLVKQVGLRAVLEAYLKGSRALLEDPVVAEWVYQVGSRSFAGAELAQDWDALKDSAKNAV